MIGRGCAWHAFGACSLVACVSSLALAFGAAADNSAVYTDPAGDVQAAAGIGGPIPAVDITMVTVTDVTATGRITFTVTAGGFGTRGGTSLLILLNTDQNAATGQPPWGDDYRIGLSQGSGLIWHMSAWGGGGFQALPDPASLTTGRSGDVFTWTVAASDLGATSGFTFHASASRLDQNGKVIGPDLAPDAGVWTYKLSTPPTTATTTTTTPTRVVQPVIAAPKTTPAHPQAGKRFNVGFRVTRSDNGEPLLQGAMGCDPKVAGKVIAHAERFANGLARLTLTVPKSAKGKLLTVKVTIRTGSAASTRIARFTVR